MNRFGRSAAVVAGMALAVATAIGGTNAAGGSPSPKAGVDDSVHLNEIQVIGSHNSYHEVPPKDEEELRRQFISDGANLMQYTHKPLPVQFQNQKVRQIELDVFVDRSGGLYSNPLLRSALGKGPWQPDVMNQPGLKVLHIQDVDYVSTCLTLKACLQQVKGWSDSNPSHMPIAILLELKDSPLKFGDLTFTEPEPWDAAALDELDNDIRSIMPAEKLITPDDVRGTHATLEDAVLAHDAWPTLGESRGKVMFLMDNSNLRSLYTAGRPSLEGRVIFTNSSAGSPDAAFVKMNDPSQVSEIQDLVRKGYVVRTRADGDTVEARDNNTGPRDNALRSGAQWVSTDYPVANLAVGFTTPYVAEIPGGTVARCNPVNGPEDCVSADIDTVFTPDPIPGPTTSTSTTAPTATTAAAKPGPKTAAPAATVRANPAYTG